MSRHAMNYWVLPALALLGAGCSSVPHYRCLAESGSPSPVLRWYGARLESVHGLGTRCEAPAVVKGTFQPCREGSYGRDCVSRDPFPEQTRTVMQVWVRINHSTSRIVGWTREDCGDYQALVSIVEGPDGRTTHVYFDVREFRAVRDIGGVTPQLVPAPDSLPPGADE